MSKPIFLPAMAAVWAGSAVAAPPIDTGGSVKARLETVDADGFSEDSTALTLRASAFARWEPTSWLTLFGEAEGVAALIDDYDDGEGAPQNRPVIPDPSFAEVNQLFAEIRPRQGLRARAGRMKIAYGEERFVGAVAFRQNHQSFDAVDGAIDLPAGARLDLAYVAGVNRPLGLRGDDRRLESDSLLVRGEGETPLGTLAAFYYDLDLGAEEDIIQVAGRRSTTWGVSLDGQRGNEPVAFTYGFTWATQDNDNTGETMPYLRARGGVLTKKFSVDARFERLGAGQEAFQTPLGTNHAFQGHADLFLVTPTGGIEDLSVGGRISLGDHGPFNRLALAARYHRFDPAESGLRYGDEIDVTASWTWDRLSLSVERADYRAEAFGTDTTRWWLTAATKF